jgi:hypothetical protein
MIADELRELDHWINIAVITTRHTVYLTLLYFVQPHFLRFCALKRIPFVFLLAIQYSVFVVMYMLLFGALVSQYTPVPTYVRTINNIGIAIPFFIALAGIFGREAALSLFSDPSCYPTWKRFRIQNTSIPEQLSNELQGQIRYIKAQSPQSVVFTDQGQAEIKMSLSEAASHLPDDLGWRAHRSYWIAKSDCTALFYAQGNPQVRLTGGEIVPINRDSVGKIRCYLSTRKHERQERSVS